MKKFIHHKILQQFFLLSICILLTSDFGFGNTIYVAQGATGTGTITNPAGLQTALNMARTNGLDDILLLQSGNYDASANTFTYDTTNNDNHDVVVSGGWNNQYNSQTMDYSLTTLDGGGVNQVFYIGANKPGLNYHFSFYNLTIQKGYTTNKLGAGLWAYNGSTANNDVGDFKLSIDQCNFNHNNATTSMSGGAIYANCYFEIYRSKFYTNSAYNGGAIVSSVKPDLDQTMSPLIENCYFEDNSNYGNQGSTIWHNVTLRFMNSTIKGRTDGVSSAGNGSAIWGNNGSFTIAHNCMFTKIWIQYWGCAIQTWDAGMELVNCVFKDNKILLNGYAVVTYFHNNGATDRKIIITNCTFVGNNTSAYDGGAIHMRLNGNDSCIVTNCIFSNNGYNSIEREYSSSYAGASYSLIGGGYAGYGFTNAGNNLGDVNPVFESTTDYHLASGSPCINSGNNFAPSLLPYDIEGTIRKLGNTVDMGAYEFNRAPTSISLNNYSVNENVPAGTFVSLITAADPDAGDTHTFSLSAGNGTNDADNQNFSINNDSLFIKVSPDFEQQPAYHIFLRAYDSGGKDTTRAITIAVNDLNEAPIVLNPIVNQQAVTGAPFAFTFPLNTFSDQDAGDLLDYSASLSGGGALPAWLSFNKGTRTFSGTPTAKETIEIKVTATDLGLLSVSDDFSLVITYPQGISVLQDHNISVFPSPAFGNRLFIQTGTTFFDQPAAIYSPEGKLLLQFEITKALSEINIGMLQTGTYILILNKDGERYITRFSAIKN